MGNNQNIVILGGSFAGLSAAHYALKHVIPKLEEVVEDTTYTVFVVNPSKEFWWRIGAARAILSRDLMPDSKMYYSIPDAFPKRRVQFGFIQGTAFDVNTAEQSVHIAGDEVTVEENVGKFDADGNFSLRYTALVIATGMSTPCPLFTQDAGSERLKAMHDAFRKQITSIRSVVIGGAGPVGVEVAGEISEFLNGKPGLLQKEPKKPWAKVHLISSEKQVLPLLREELSNKAIKYLKRVGCKVILNTKVVSATTVENREPTNPAYATTVELSQGDPIRADVYIDATGVRPNTSFLPKAWLDAWGRVNCNPQTLRVEKAGPRVYVVGDAGSYSRGGALDVQDAVPVAMTNLKTDLLAYYLNKPPGADRHYTPPSAVSQICPIGTQKGVGMYSGKKIPGFIIQYLKGRDYMAGQLVPLYLNGDAYKKDKKWTPMRRTYLTAPGAGEASGTATGSGDVAGDASGAATGDGTEEASEVPTMSEVPTKSEVPTMSGAAGAGEASGAASGDGAGDASGTATGEASGAASGDGAGSVTGDGAGDATASRATFGSGPSSGLTYVNSDGLSYASPRPMSVDLDEITHPIGPRDSEEQSQSQSRPL